MIRKDAIFAVLTTFCLSSLMFIVIPIRSGQPYDLWANVDDNSKAKNVNVTNWPSQLLPNYVNDSGFFTLATGGSNGSYIFRALSIAGYRQVSIYIGYDFNLDVDMLVEIDMGWSSQHAVLPETDYWWNTYRNQTRVQGAGGTLGPLMYTIDVCGPELTVSIHNLKDYPMDYMRIIVYATC